MPSIRDHLISKLGKGLIDEISSTLKKMKYEFAPVIDTKELIDYGKICNMALNRQSDRAELSYLIFNEIEKDELTKDLHELYGVTVELVKGTPQGRKTSL